MARPLRIEFPDAIYHVTARGVERGAIMVSKRDGERWLEQLERVVGRCRWRVFAFALMPNHYHLFVQTPEPNLSAGMRDLNGGYATWFNVRHERAGHLFQGRFKALLVEEEGYWLEVGRYVHLNPVRAGLVARPEEWRWGSYPGYHRPAQRRPWLDYSRILAEFGGDTATARRRYREFIEAGLGRELDSPLAAARHGFILGSERFVQRIQELLGEDRRQPDVPELERLRARPSLAQVIAAVTEHYGTSASDWAPGRRSNHPARWVAAYLGRRVAGATNRAVAEALGYRNPSSVTVACRRVEGASGRSKIGRDVRELMAGLGGS